MGMHKTKILSRPVFKKKWISTSPLHTSTHPPISLPGILTKHLWEKRRSTYN